MESTQVTIKLLGLLVASCLVCGCGEQFSAWSMGGASMGMLQKGMLAPSLPTKTLADVGGDMSKMTTYRQPDARMYQYSLDKALALGKPIVLEFATPGHCTVCDGQLQIMKALMEKYQSQVLFLHMDQYQNPQAFKAYRVMGDPWTFFIDDKGIVSGVQPGRMLHGEMEAGITKILKVATVSNAG
jgi:thiol-disulfide isomerase/thioredoxin